MIIFSGATGRPWAINLREIESELIIRHLLPHSKVNNLSISQGYFLEENNLSARFCLFASAELYSVCLLNSWEINSLPTIPEPRQHNLFCASEEEAQVAPGLGEFGLKTGLGGKCLLECRSLFPTPKIQYIYLFLLDAWETFSLNPRK